MPMQNLGEQTKSIMLLSQVAYTKYFKDCGLHPILLITLMIQDIENIKQLNFELF